MTAYGISNSICSLGSHIQVGSVLEQFIRFNGIPNYDTNLRDVNIGSLGPGHHHDFKVVELCEGTLGRASSLVSSVVQDSEHKNSINQCSGSVSL